MKIKILLLLLLFISSCKEDGDVYNSEEKKLETPEFLQLVDDSTNIAGILNIMTNAPEIGLKWNIPSGCNLDTTQTVVKVNNGKCSLPIQWIKREGNTFGPTDRIFNVGVLVSAAGLSKYVPLLWTQEVDTVSLINSIQTRAAFEVPSSVVLQAIPELVSMDIVAGGNVMVFFTGTPAVSVDQTSILAETNIDKTKIPLSLKETGMEIPLRWINAGAPKFNFTTQLKLNAPGLILPVPINYVVPSTDPAIWEFIGSTPSEGNSVLANEAKIVVQVKTNKPWSLECDNGLTSPVSDFGTALENRSLVMHLSNNTSTDSRQITVLVKSQGVLQKTLTFNQMGQGQTGVFDFLSSTPANGEVLPGSETSVDVKVQTDLAWWVKCDCGKRMDYPASALGEKTGTVTVTENKTGTPRVVTITVGYGDTVVETLTFSQLGNGGGAGTVFNFVSAVPENNAIIPSSATTATVKVNTDYAWWINFNGTRTDYPASALGDKTGTITIPANTGTTDKPITYTIGYGTTTAQTITYTQKGTNGGESDTLVIGTILPYGDIPGKGTKCYSILSKGPGKVKLRAMRNGVQVAMSDEVDVPESRSVVANLTIPALINAPATNVVFQYSIDGGAWKTKDTRKQLSDTESDGYIVIAYTGTGNLPATNAIGTFLLQGTPSQSYTITAYWGKTVIGSATGTPTPEGRNLNVKIADNNTGAARDITFSWSVNGTTYTNTGAIKQAGR